MANVDLVKIEGLKEIEAKLNALPKRVRNRHLRRIMHWGSEIVRKEGEARAPRGTRTRPDIGWMAWIEADGGPRLSENIVSKVVIHQDGNATATVGIDYSKVRHGHLVEFGTRAHWIPVGKGRVLHPGSKPYPFMRPAFDGKANASVEYMLKNFVTAIEREAEYGR